MCFFFSINLEKTKNGPLIISQHAAKQKKNNYKIKKTRKSRVLKDTSKKKRKGDSSDRKRLVKQQESFS